MRSENIKEIPGFPGYYAGDDGSIYSKWALKRGGKGGLSSFIGDSLKQLNLYVREKGYKHVGLRRRMGRHNKLVHRLVLETFVGPCPSGMVCCHNNGDSSDNRLSNLRWDTSKENAADQQRHGKQIKGEAHPIHKLTEDQVREIRKSSGQTYAELGRRFNIAGQTARSAAIGHTWKHVGDLPPVKPPAQQLSMFA